MSPILGLDLGKLKRVDRLDNPEANAARFVAIPHAVANPMHEALPPRDRIEISGKIAAGC